MSRTKAHFINYSEALFPRDHNSVTPSPRAGGNNISRIKLFAKDSLPNGSVRARDKNDAASVLITEFTDNTRNLLMYRPALPFFYLPRTAEGFPSLAARSTHTDGGFRVNANSNKIYFRRTRRSPQYFMSEMNIHGAISPLTT